MSLSGPHGDQFGQLLSEELWQPTYLTPQEVAGGWRILFPELAACLPPPYPIHRCDEETVVTRGYPVLISAGVTQLRRDLERLAAAEAEYRLAAGADKAKVMAQRERYLRSMSAIAENTLLNDYGRGLFEILLLFHSRDIAQMLSRGGSVIRERTADTERRQAEELRYGIAAVFADLLQRSAVAAIDRLKQLARTAGTPSLTPLLAAICQDLLLLGETRTPFDLNHLVGYVKVRFRQDVDTISSCCRRAQDRLDDLLDQRPDLGRPLLMAAGGGLDLKRSHALLDPRLLDAIAAAGLAGQLGLGDEELQLLRELGMRLKRFELLNALRRRVLSVERRGSDLLLVGSSPECMVSASTRPLDFTAPGVVDSAIRRFGLVYDLTSFTAQLEELRKKGPAAEEKALQFMYVFQSRLEEIRQRRRLTFEKYLGDGAFYSARRALRVITAACETQQLYDQLRRSGFPFDQGIRLAMNHGTYRLLPMLTHLPGEQHFEFFGHGIVELGRLTTGKSTREAEEIASFLVNSGFDPAAVDEFLRPLLSAPSGAAKRRPYFATIGAHGELVNEGIVLSLPFLEELEKDMHGVTPHLVHADGLHWALFPGDSSDGEAPYFGLRYLGVARLKGLQPVELIEAAVWSELPPGSEVITTSGPLVELLRRIDKGESAAPEAATVPIAENLVVVTFLDDSGERCWFFGEYDPGDDLLHNAIQAPIRAQAQDMEESPELWLLDNRFELNQLYEALRRQGAGSTVGVAALRHRRSYLGCYLAAPHRSPR